MSVELFNRRFQSTVPNDLLDPPKFAQPHECSKDAILLELRKFFNNFYISANRREEIPTLEKYEFRVDLNDPFSTAVQILRKHPDVLENLPHVAVLASSGTERKLTIGPPFIATVQEPAQFIGTASEPFVLADFDKLVVITKPNGYMEFSETLTFRTGRFPITDPIAAALAVDVVRVINEQALHFRASVEIIGGLNFIKLSAGGPLDRSLTPASIRIGRTTDENVLTELGIGRTGELIDVITGIAPNMFMTAASGSFSVADLGKSIEISGSTQSLFNNGRFPVVGFGTGLVDTITYTNKNGRAESATPARWFIGLEDNYFNPLRPPKHRYAQAADFTITIDVITEDENTRGELSDLVMSFFTFFAEEKYFTFMGRSTFDSTIANEYYQIVLQPPFRSAGEAEFPRPTDNSGKVYINSFSVDVHTSMYLDRTVLIPGTITPFIVTGNVDLVPDEIGVDGITEEDL